MVAPKTTLTLTLLLLHYHHLLLLQMLTTQKLLLLLMLQHVTGTGVERALTIAWTSKLKNTRLLLLLLLLYSHKLLSMMEIGRRYCSTGSRCWDGNDNGVANVTAAVGATTSRSRSKARATYHGRSDEGRRGSIGLY